MKPIHYALITFVALTCLQAGFILGAYYAVHDKLHAIEIALN